MEQNGKLVPELTSHGLTGLPTGAFRIIEEVPVETYSNNMGFYNQVFMVVSATNVGGSETGKLFLDIVAACGPVQNRVCCFSFIVGALDSCCRSQDLRSIPPP